MVGAVRPAPVIIAHRRRGGDYNLRGCPETVCAILAHRRTGGGCNGNHRQCGRRAGFANDRRVWSLTINHQEASES